MKPSTPFGRALAAEVEGEMAASLRHWELDDAVLNAIRTVYKDGAGEFLQRVLTRMHEEAGDTPDAT